jgi:hypothetical protein
MPPSPLSAWYVSADIAESGLLLGMSQRHFVANSAIERGPEVAAE